MLSSGRPDLAQLSIHRGPRLARIESFGMVPSSHEIMGTPSTCSIQPPGSRLLGRVSDGSFIGTKGGLAIAINNLLIAALVKRYPLLGGESSCHVAHVDQIKPVFPSPFFGYVFYFKDTVRSGPRDGRRKEVHSSDGN